MAGDADGQGDRVQLGASGDGSIPVSMFGPRSDEHIVSYRAQFGFRVEMDVFLTRYGKEASIYPFR